MNGDGAKKRATSNNNKRVKKKNSLQLKRYTPELDRQTELLFRLKEQIDLVLKLIHRQNCCVERAERFRKQLKTILTNKNDDEQRTKELLNQQFAKFEQNFNFCRKRYRKMNRKCQLKSSPGTTLPAGNNLYDTLYDLYQSMTIDGCQQDEICITETDIKVELTTPTELNCPLRDCSKLHKTKPEMITHLHEHSNEMKKEAMKKNSATKAKSKKVTAKEIRIKLSAGKNKKAESSKKKKPLKCKFDGCTFLAKTKMSLGRHRSIHNEERPFKCDQCDRTFKSAGTHNLHLRVHSNERFRCDFDGCGENFRDGRGLRKHMAIVHTKQAPTYQCQWQDCKYSSYRRELLRKHETVHTGERAFPCIWPDCDKSFKTKSAHYDHMLMHKNERRYKCSWAGCSYSSNLLGNLHKHEAIHERKKVNLNRDKQQQELQQQQQSNCLPESQLVDGSSSQFQLQLLPNV